MGRYGPAPGNQKKDYKEQHHSSRQQLQEQQIVYMEKDIANTSKLANNSENNN